MQMVLMFDALTIIKSVCGGVQVLVPPARPDGEAHFVGISNKLNHFRAGQVSWLEKYKQIPFIFNMFRDYRAKKKAQKQTRAAAAVVAAGGGVAAAEEDSDDEKDSILLLRLSLLPLPLIVIATSSSSH